MKKVYLSFVAGLFACSASYAQFSSPVSGLTTTTDNVGIGTNTPLQKLDVNGNIQISNSSIPMGVITELPGGTTPLLNLSLNFRESNKNQNYVGAGIRIDSRPDQPLFQWLKRAAGETNENLLMILNNDGNLGLGTSDTHGFKLAVNGSIRAKEIKVESGPWPDYVFDSTYKLLPLIQLQSFINKNKHLPDMPSEAEVVKEGINLGEIVRVQTKKIEELTLYLIDQNRRIESLSKENYNIKKHLNAIKTPKVKN